MPEPNSKSLTHRCLSQFVDWIKTPEDREDTIRTQAEDVRNRIRAKAEANGLVIRSTPYAGSIAKRTGLRRHYQGNVAIEGQDVDLSFVVSPETRAGDSIKTLIGLFQSYAQATYPNTTLRLTNSSVRLEFVATKLNYDIVPMLAVRGDDQEQIILRGDGEQRRTSRQKHVEFIKKRTRESNEQPGRVKFNEVVRLVKWWRELRQDKSQILHDVPTIIIDLLCAKAFDETGVEWTYTTTLSRWFDIIADIARRRVQVGFTDFVKDPLAKSAGMRWAVVDPVNSENNVIPVNWDDRHLTELAAWFEEARDQMRHVIASETASDSSGTKRALVDIFGNPFKHHGVVDEG